MGVKPIRLGDPAFLISFGHQRAFVVDVVGRTACAALHDDLGNSSFGLLFSNRMATLCILIIPFLIYLMFMEKISPITNEPSKCKKCKKIHSSPGGNRYIYPSNVQTQRTKPYYCIHFTISTFTFIKNSDRFARAPYAPFININYNIPDIVGAKIFRDGSEIPRRIINYKGYDASLRHRYIP